MKQIVQNLKTGETNLVEIPVPQIRARHLLSNTSKSLISLGTERMIVEFGKAGWINKARQQPDKVRKVMDKVRTDGFMPTIEAVRSKLDQPLPLGYCNTGTILEIGDLGIAGLKVGDRIVSNGPHAEVVCVPKILCAKIPDVVSDEKAAFTILGATGLQGVRLLQPTIGECFVVTGLGLIGLLSVQILRANGCRVLGIDLDSAKCGLARQFGAETVDISNGEDPVDAAMVFSKGRGVDGALITAATMSSQPVHQAAQMCRKRGRIVLVGVTGLELNRPDFYEKELSFQVSCSYGPGRYDSEYEEKGQDYPFGYVRWTEQRNFEAVLDLMVAGKIDVKPLISHRFRFEEAGKAYKLIAENRESYVGIILDYDSGIEEFRNLGIKKDERTVTLKPSYEPTATDHQLPVIGFIGAGSFTAQVLLPAIRKTGARLKIIASSGGVTGTHLGKKFGFEESTTDVEEIFGDPEINTVVVATRHNTHARFVMEALRAGKNVFVEKPLCIKQSELMEIHKVYSSLIANHSSLPLLLVGFNRRFAPHVVRMKELLATVREPKSMIMTVNAGAIPSDHWVHDPEVGGGRLIGEVCHCVDLFRFLSGSEITESRVVYAGMKTRDTLSIQMTSKDGSICAVQYFANGNKGFSKDRLEVFAGGRILQLDNFRVLRDYGWKGFKKLRLWRQDKGYHNEFHSFIDAITNGKPSPIPFEEIIEVAKISLDLSLKT